MRLPWLVLSPSLATPAVARTTVGAQGTSEGARSAAGAQPTVSAGEVQLFNRLHAIDTLEIEAGKLATRTSHSQQVSAFGRKLIRDHEKADRDLDLLARQEHVAIQAPLSPRQSIIDRARNRRRDATLEVLRGQTGADFDRHWLTLMVDSHRDAANMLTSAAGDLRRTKLGALITDRVLPMIQMHQTEASDLLRSTQRLGRR